MRSEKTNLVITEFISTDPKHWVSKYADYLYAYAITRINDAEQARDLVQETFLAALERLDKFEGRSTESTWLTAILKNKIIDLYRKKSSGFSKNTSLQDAENEVQDFFDAGNGHWKPEHSPREMTIPYQDPMAEKEFNQMLQNCIQKLPALWSAIFTMKHLDEELTENICAELKVSPANFWVIIHRTKLNLRACLQKNWI